jgi:photosystem II stability/assembly factor-like uncharacterized protein
MLGSPVRVSLRGLHVVNERTVWVSGEDGTVLLTVDGGAQWRQVGAADHREFDFRDVHAWSDREAIVVNAGAPAVIYRTENGGASWTQTYGNDAPQAFLDGVDFIDADRGIAFSDPVDGSFLVITTHDRGRSWTEISQSVLPPSIDGEAGFAASGTCVATFLQSSVWIGTGGHAARILYSGDFGESWHVAKTPLRSGAASTGVFSVAMKSAAHGVIVGGDYQSPDSRNGTAAVTRDGGRSWLRPSGRLPRGYRSAVAVNPRTGQYVAVGPNGSDCSTAGDDWAPFSAEGFHAVCFEPSGTGWAVGADGRIARLQR